MRVTLLGTGTPVPSADRFGYSTLIEAGGRKLLFDFGQFQPIASQSGCNRSLSSIDDLIARCISEDKKGNDMRARSELLSGAARPKKKAGKAGAKPAIVSRMAPADRKAMILARATEFFADYGLTAQTRPLAAACGVAQRLLYRYFPSKAALLDEVYQQGIVAPFKAVWLVRLKDRTRPFEQRLAEFYSHYYADVLTRKWLRLFLYASLAEVRMAPDYIAAIILEMLE